MEIALRPQTDLDADFGGQVGGEVFLWDLGPLLKFWGYETQDWDSDDMHFQRIDYGGAIRLNLSLRRELGPSDESGENQCTRIHLAAALERLNRRSPKRAHRITGLKRRLRN